MKKKVIKIIIILLPILAFLTYPFWLIKTGDYMDLGYYAMEKWKNKIDIKYNVNNSSKPLTGSKFIYFNYDERGFDSKHNNKLYAKNVDEISVIAFYWKEKKDRCGCYVYRTSDPSSRKFQMFYTECLHIDLVCVDSWTCFASETFNGIPNADSWKYECDCTNWCINLYDKVVVDWIEENIPNGEFVLHDSL